MENHKVKIDRNEDLKFWSHLGFAVFFCIAVAGLSVSR